MNLFRAPILWVTARPWFRRFIVGSRPGRSVVRRFVAGEGLDDAMRAAGDLHAAGISSMLDLLGENVTTEEGAVAAADEHLEAIVAIRGTAPQLGAAISVKLTQLGLDLSEDLAQDNLARVLDAAGARTLVMIDMEHHEYVDATLRVFRELHEGYDGLGVCLQAYLHRTAEDIFELPEASIVRLVKGAYLEPHDLAFSRSGDVERAWSLLFATLVARGHRVHVATHDPALIAGARQLVRRRGIPRERVEYQMLYGIRPDLQRRLARDGLPVRVYVPYGTEWYPYLTRRLAERPANLWFFLRSLAASTTTTSSTRSSR